MQSLKKIVPDPRVPEIGRLLARMRHVIVDGRQASPAFGSIRVGRLVLIDTAVTRTERARAQAAPRARSARRKSSPDCASSTYPRT